MSKYKKSVVDNPCSAEQDLSYKCLNSNGFDNEKCEIYFTNYNNCKKFWGNVAKDRRLRGVVPHLPGVEERERIKSDFLSRNENNIG